MSTDAADDHFQALKVKVEGESLLRHFYFREHSLDLGGQGDRLKRRAVFLTGLSDQFAHQEILEPLLGNFGDLQSIVVHPSQVLPYTALPRCCFVHSDS